MKRTIFIFALTLALPSFCQPEPEANLLVATLYHIIGRYSAYAVGSVLAAKAAPGAIAGGAISLAGRVVAEDITRYSQFDKETSCYYADKAFELFVVLGVTTGVSITLLAHLKSRSATANTHKSVGISLYRQEISLRSAVLTGLSIRLVMDLLDIPDLAYAYNKLKSGCYQAKEMISQKVSVETEAHW